MIFTSLSFIIFLAVLLIVYYAIPSRFRWIVLLVGSLVFYCMAGLQFLPFILFTSMSTFLGARQIGKVWQKQKDALSQEGLDSLQKKSVRQQYQKSAKRYLVVTLVVNLLILCYSKYTKFFIPQINELLQAIGISFSVSNSSIIVPLGISYYTFSTLGYLLDVYWKRYQSEENPARFLLYTCYFPHILQGPIARYNRLGERLKAVTPLNARRLLYGFQLMLWGFFKKLVIADRASIFVNGILNSTVSASGALMLLSVFLDVLCIYTDFSGCMDIARGASSLFGIELDLNFNRPFFSKSVTEFWRRWHMSLGSWFKDYVYYPISTSSWLKKLVKRRKQANPRHRQAIATLFPVCCTWILTGVWHGSGLPYIAWGIYYAFMIMCSVTFQPEFHKLTTRLKIRTDTLSWRAFQAFRTTCIFAFGRLLVRPDDLLYSARMLKRFIFNFEPWAMFDGKIFQYGLSAPDFNVLIICTVILLLVSLYQRKGSVRDALNRQNTPVVYAAMLLCIFGILILGIYGPGYSASTFAYMNY